MARKKANRRSRRGKTAPRKSAPVRQRSTQRKRTPNKAARRARARPAKPSRRNQFTARRKQDTKRLRAIERELQRKKKRLRKLQDTRIAERKRAETAFTNLESRLRAEQERVRKQGEVIEDLTRPRRQIFQGEGGEDEDEDGAPFQHVPGEIPVRDRGGEIIGYELPEIMADAREDIEGFDEGDFLDFDWDDFIDQKAIT